MVKETFKKGYLLVNPESVIDPEHLALLQAEYEAYEVAEKPFSYSFRASMRVATVTFMILVLGRVERLLSRAVRKAALVWSSEPPERLLDRARAGGGLGENSVFRSVGA